MPQLYYFSSNTSGMSRSLTAWSCLSRVGFCGVMSVFSSLRYCLSDGSSYYQVWLALALLPFGLFFDFLDGRVARWRNKSSLMGQELDSLADLVWIMRTLGIDPRIGL